MCPCLKSTSKERARMSAGRSAPAIHETVLALLVERDIQASALLAVRYSGRGRVPFTRVNWPIPLRAREGHKGRAFSGNVLVVAQGLRNLLSQA